MKEGRFSYNTGIKNCDAVKYLMKCKNTSCYLKSKRGLQDILHIMIPFLFVDIQWVEVEY